MNNIFHYHTTSIHPIYVNKEWVQVVFEIIVAEFFTFYWDDYWEENGGFESVTINLN